ncbi:ABC transporter substrate-binding protein [Paenibacillus sp. FSL H7-0331]|uniref:ABC transporter substrate-binding protein n=1 Tax=Paenibacillus sp. FSL H7-0331 TaxID=1920421 RepID=UPI00096FBCD4|nr:extracellular solute-binding protein [Paenibacillus sp. FSL H7-0331]OMF11648.1 ABC transporter substrate-binding protein [Paenibacillus sp. FSL H7-0331]
MNRNWMRMALGMSVAVGMLLTGCGTEVSSSLAGKGAEVSSQSEPKPAEDTGKTIYLYGNDFVDLVAPKFTSETGFKMEAVHYGGGEALAKIEAEQGNPQWDVLMMDGHGSVRSLADRDFLMKGWKPANLSKLSEYGTSLVPKDYAYYPVGIHAAAVIAYNTKLVPADKAPKTWEQFFAYSGPVGHADPAVAAPAYPLVSAFFQKWGVEETKKKYKQRFEAGMRVYPKNGPVGKALVSGEIHVAALQEHNAYELKLAGEPVEVIWPDEGAPGSLRVIAISKKTKNSAAAQAFVEYMMKPEMQAMLTSLPSTESLFTPLAQGVQMRKERRQDGSFLLPPAEWAAQQEAPIKTWFADQNVK